MARASSFGVPALVLLGCVIAFGCAPARVRRAPELPASLPTADHLLASLARRRGAVTSVRGFARISYEGEGRTVGSRHAVVAERPAKLRLEVLGPLGAIAVLASDGHELALYIRRDARVYRGPATADSVAAYAAVRMPVADIVDVLLGVPPERTPSGEDAIVTPEPESGRIRLTVPISGGRQEIWFAADTLAPVASATPLPDGTTLRVDFDAFRTDTGVTFPYSVDVRMTPGDRAIRVRYTTPAVGKRASDDLFVIPVRAGIDERAIGSYRPEVAAPEVAAPEVAAP